jgi:hypothetical protein
MTAELKKDLKNYTSFTIELSKFVAAWYRDEITQKEVADTVEVLGKIYPSKFLFPSLTQEWIMENWPQNGSDHLPYTSSGSHWRALFDYDFLDYFLTSENIEFDPDEVNDFCLSRFRDFLRMNPVELR